MRLHGLQRGHASGAGDPLRSTSTGGGVAAVGGGSPVAHRSGSPYSAYANHVDSVVVSQNNLIVVLTGTNTSVATGVTDNASGGSNTYTALTAAGPPSAGGYARIFYAIAKASETLTITMAGGDDPGLSVHVYVNTATSDVLEVEATSAVNTVAGEITLTTGNMVTSLTNGVIVAIAGNEVGDPSFVPGANLTQRTYETGHVHFTEDRIISTGGTYTASITQNTTTSTVLAAAMFKGL